MSDHTRDTLRASAIIASATFVTVLISLVRIKIVALLLGPSGVGLLGLLNNIMSTAKTLAGMGLGSSAVRQVASAKDPQTLARLRLALFSATLVLGLVGATAVYLLREQIAVAILGGKIHASTVGWLGLGVFLSVVAGSQTALLQGMRRIGDLARVGILSALLATSLGVTSVWMWGLNGVLFLVLTGPLASGLTAAFYVRRLPSAEPVGDLRQVPQHWWPLLRLGFVFMLAAFVGQLGGLGIRALVRQELGLEAVGQFHAAWTISMQYIGFVLGAMAADYYPKLTAMIKDKKQANRLVNEQAEIALLLAGAVLLAMQALAPVVIYLLYSEAFLPSVNILRWHILGDILKIGSWPLGFILVAQGRGLLFLGTESLWHAVALFLLWILLPIFGLASTGYMFAAAYLMYFLVITQVAKKIQGCRLNAQVLTLLLMLLGTNVALMALSYISPIATGIIGCIASVGFLIYALRRLAAKVGPDGRLGRLLSHLNRFVAFVPGFQEWTPHD